MGRHCANLRSDVENVRKKFRISVVIRFKANEVELVEVVIMGTQSIISHTGIFDPIKNVFFSGTPNVRTYSQLGI